MNRINTLRVRSNGGFTAIEALLATAAGFIIMVVIVMFWPKIFTFFTTMQARQQANMEGRRCLATLEHLLLEGQAKTMVISSPPTSPIPNSSIQFVASDRSLCKIAWSATPMNTVHLYRTPFGSVVANDTVLATHVNSLEFVIPDPRDPSLVKVSLVIKVPLNSTGTPDSFYTFYIPEELIQMVAS